MLASPSSSSVALYGLPAGRPFRVIGREGGFAHIQDLKSSASGWIDEFALAEPPRAPAASTAAQPKTFSAGGKSANASAGPKSAATQKDTSVATTSKTPRTGPQPPWLIWSRGPSRWNLRQWQLVLALRSTAPSCSRLVPAPTLERFCFLGQGIGLVYREPQPIGNVTRGELGPV